MRTSTDLRELLSRIDRRSYPAYKDTRGAYQFPGYVLSIDHVQGDPFASPSQLSVRVSGKTAGFPPALYHLPCQRIALQDALLRRFGQEAAKVSFQAKGSGHSGLISVSRCGQEVLERSSSGSSSPGWGCAPSWRTGASCPGSPACPTGPCGTRCPSGPRRSWR